MKRLLLVITIVVSINTMAQPKSSSYSLFVDEDFWQRFGSNTDQNYTMGIGAKTSNALLSNSPVAEFITRVKDKAGSWRGNKTVVKPAGNEEVPRYFPLAEKENMVNRSGYLVLVGNGFTPTNLNTSAIQYNDRPYASIVSLTYGVGRLYYPKDKVPRIYQTEVTLGLLGTGTAPQLQTWIHRMTNNNDTENPHTPKGWPNQVSNGGEPTFMVLNRSKLLLASFSGLKNKRSEVDPDTWFRWFELTFGRESFIGYYTGAGLSLGGRVGILDFRNWTGNIFPLQSASQVAEGEMSDKDKKRKTFDSNRKFELYLSSEIKPMITLYNAMLQGQFRHSAYTISGNNINPFGYNWNNAVGFSTPLSRKLNLNGVYNFYAYKSPEFRRADYVGKSHVWGGIYITLSYFAGD